MQVYIISLSSELLLIKTGDKSLNFLLEYLSNPSKIVAQKEVMGHVLFNDLVFIGATITDSVITRIESSLSRIIQLLNDYFKPLTENAIKSDFSTVYNLIVDSSLISANSNLLFQLYPPSTILNKVTQVIYSSPTPNNTLVLGEHDWRNSTVRYSVDQIWFDFVEKIRISSNDKETVGDISGQLKVSSNLSGTFIH